MFSYFDLIFPWGTALLACTLGIWGFLKTTIKPAKIICLLFALVFTLPVPILYATRAAYQKYDYQTPHGMKVRQGELNHCDRENVEVWEKWTRDFWLKTYPEFCINEANRQAFLICKDTQTTESKPGRFVKGYAWEHTAVITYKPGNPAYTESLFKHEFSHLILFECLGSVDGDLHHRLFKDMELGH